MEDCQVMEWYCVHTRPREEDAAAQYCRQFLELQVFYPRLSRRKITGQIKLWVIGPLFPRYFFCRMNLATRCRAVRYAPHIIDVVRFGGRPAVVDDSTIEELMRWARDPVDAVSISPILAPGDRVEIIDGPLRGLQAIFQQELSDKERIALLLTTLACQPRLVLNRSQVVPAA